MLYMQNNCYYKNWFKYIAIPPFSGNRFIIIILDNQIVVIFKLSCLLLGFFCSQGFGKMVVLGFVKWFSTPRGFGFIQSDAVIGDIFFHVTDLHRIGGLSADSGDKIVCKIIMTNTQDYKAERIFYFKNEQRNFYHLDDEVETLILNNTIEIFKNTRSLINI